MMKRGVWTLGMRGEVLEYGVKNTLTVIKYYKGVLKKTNISCCYKFTFISIYSSW